MYEFLTFRKMVAPIIIQILFWVGVAVSVIVGLVMVVAGIAGAVEHGPEGLLGVLVGLLSMFIGPIVCRVYAEVLILLFRIYESLIRIEGNTAGLGGTGARDTGVAGSPGAP